MPLGLSPDPFLEKLLVGKLPRIRQLGRRLGLSAVKAQQRGDAGDHIGHGKIGAPGHDIGRVKLDRSKGNAALILAHAGLDKFPDEGADDFAG